MTIGDHTDIDGSVLRFFTTFDLDEVTRFMRAAEQLDLGVRISNAWVPSEDDERVLEWSVVVLDETPEADE
jgi:hypothetical protein